MDPESLRLAMEGVQTAYYLVHSMGAPEDFEKLDRQAAANFAAAAAGAGVRTIVYLGGLGTGDGLSSHLASRHEVGRILEASGVPTIELRASIVIGSGSASYETVRALVERLPAIPAPRWVETRAQPIAVEDVVEYLLAAREWPPAAGGAVFEIGGSDQVTYADVMREYARLRRLRRRVIRVPLITPGGSKRLLGLLTPVYGQIAAAMVESLRNETVVHNDDAMATFAVRPRGLTAAIERAMANEDLEFAETRWSDAMSGASPPSWGGTTFGQRMVSSRVIAVGSPPDAAFGPIQRLGGPTGWYALNWFWRLRGLLDTMRGGVGLRRGRRDPQHLRAGDAVDFWRVEQIEPGHLLRLAAEMRIPGRLWLQFEVDPSEEGSQIRQTTVFDPAGWVGLVYWHVLYPVHQGVFAAMLRGIRTATHGTAGPSARACATGRALHV
jgi:uncharacterized protein YbjT (DUF2867 family)